jgi:hypothetical protein
MPMNTVLRLALGTAVLLGVVWLCLIWSWWLTLFGALALLVAAAARYFKNKKRWTSIGVGVLTIVVLLALGHFGVLPSISRRTSNRSTTASCTSTPTQEVFNGLRRLVAQQPSPQSRESALEQRRLEYENDASRDLFQARSAIDVDRTLTAVSRILDLQTAPGLEEDRKTVNSGSAEIRQFLLDKQLTGAEQRVRAFAEFESRLRGIVQQLKAAKTAQELDGISSLRFSAETESVMWQLAQKMFSLQESLTHLTNQSVEARPVYSILWDERQNRAVYREEIQIRSLQDAALDTLDASLLQREADTAGLPFQLSVQQADGTPAKVEDPAHILIEPRRKDIKLIYERFGVVSQPVYCASAPLSTIRRLLFVWPTSAASIRLAGILTRADEHLPVWFTIDRSKSETQVLREIRLPENSMFASARAFDVATRDGSDVLTSTHPEDLSLANFAPDQNDWIEVFNDNRILRSGITKKFKDYLVLENAISPVALFLVAGLVTLIFPKLRK